MECLELTRMRILLTLRSVSRCLPSRVFLRGCFPPPLLFEIFWDTKILLLLAGCPCCCLGHQEMLYHLENDACPEAGTALHPSRRAAGVAAGGLTYWAAARTVGALAEFSRREGVATWALVAGTVAYVFLSSLFVFYVYARKCFGSSRPAVRRVVGSGGGGGRGGGPDGGVELVGRERVGRERVAAGAGGDGEAGAGTAEVSRLLGGGDPMKDR